ncbi:MAG: flagellar hook-associated protein FlgK [Burkholderiales bacterium]|nr:flagellar hook-associated protein FlgK [Burkholderiales bacterium]
MSGLLSVGKSAMFASYAALQTTGNNIANANTAGYSRQSVQLADAAGQFSGSGFFGKGVNVVTVQRAYNELLTVQAGAASSVAAADSARLDKLTQLEGVFPIGSNGIGAAAGSLLNAFVDISSNPTDSSARQVALSSAQELASRFRNAGEQLSSLQSGVMLDMRSAVTAVNSLAQQVGRLNEQISALKGTGQPPNNLLDERDRIVSDIGKLINVTTQPAEDGSLGVFIGAGQNLVLGSVVNSLKIVSDTFDPAKAQVALRDGAADRLISASSFSGGAISGLLRFQNEDLSEANRLLGQMATAITGALNQQQSLGLDLGQPAGRGAPMLSISGARVLSSWSNAGNAQLSAAVSDPAQVQASDYELLFDGANYSITRQPDGQPVTGSPFTPALLAAGVNIDGLTIQLSAGTAQNGDRFLVQPAATAAQNMRLVLTDPRGLAAASPFTGSAGVDNRGTAAVASVLATGGASVPSLSAGFVFTSDTGDYNWTLDDGTTVTTGTGSWTPGSPITLGGFAMSLDGVPRSGDTLRVASTVSPAGNNGNALAFVKLGETALVGRSATQTGMNITDAYASALASVGVRVQGGTMASKISTVLADDAETARSNEVGVNLDEEAARLIQYQQSYQAAAKILQVAQTIFQTLLQTGGA